MKKFNIVIFGRKIGFTPLQILKDTLITVCKLLYKDTFKMHDAYKKFVTGFTLTELLVVVVILGIIATLTLPTIIKMLEKARVDEAVSNLNLIRAGQKMYLLTHNEYASRIEFLAIDDPNKVATPRRKFDYAIIEPTHETPEEIRRDNFTARADRNSGLSPYSGYYYKIKKGGRITSNGPFFPDN